MFDVSVQLSRLWSTCDSGDFSGVRKRRRRSGTRGRNEWSFLLFETQLDGNKRQHLEAHVNRVRDSRSHPPPEMAVIVVVLSGEERKFESKWDPKPLLSLIPRHRLTSRRIRAWHVIQFSSQHLQRKRSSFLVHQKNSLPLILRTTDFLPTCILPRLLCLLCLNPLVGRDADCEIRRRMKRMMGRERE